MEGYEVVDKIAKPCGTSARVHASSVKALANIKTVLV